MRELARLERTLFSLFSSVQCVLLICAVGCEGKATTYPAGGKVTFENGKPLTDGWVHFRSQNGDTPVTARGLIQSDGTFKLMTFKTDDGAVEGKHQALVTVTVVEGDLRPPVIDRRFNDFSESGLEFTVTSDPVKNDFLIVVTPPKH